MLADHGLGDLVVKVLHQPDGKIVTIASTSDANHIATTVVSRYLVNGSLDDTFGFHGVFDEGVLLPGEVADGVLQPDGKIVFVGTAENTVDFFVQRLLPDGKPDPTFAPGHPLTNFGGAHDSADEALGVALGPGGTIVVAGQSAGRVALARYTSTGALDHTFSGDGLTTHAFGRGSRAVDVAVQPDGRIIVAGSMDMGPLVARFDASGNVDPTFGTAGHVSPAAHMQSIDALYLQGTKAVVVGSVDITTTALRALQPERHARHLVRDRGLDARARRPEHQHLRSRCRRLGPAPRRRPGRILRRHPVRTLLRIGVPVLGERCARLRVQLRRPRAHRGARQRRRHDLPRIEGDDRRGLGQRRRRRRCRRNGQRHRRPAVRRPARALPG